MISTSAPAAPPEPAGSRQGHRTQNAHHTGCTRRAEDAAYGESSDLSPIVSTISWGKYPNLM
jgi:hypothetical protein